MLGLAFLPIVAFGLLALVPMIVSSTGGEPEDETDPTVEEPPVEEPPVEEPPLAVTIASEGGEAVDALTREGGTEELNGGAIINVVGTDDADVIVASDESDPDLQFRLQAGDDEITVQLGQDVDARSVFGSDAPSGADAITLEASAEDIAAYQQLSSEAEDFRDIPADGLYRVSADDTVAIEIDPAVEGRLVELVYTSYSLGLSSQEPQSQDFRGVFLVPDGVDIEERIAEEFIGAPDENGDFLVFEDGAVRLASVALGGTSTTFDQATGESTFSDSTFEWDGLTANRAIETYTINNIPV